MTNRWPPEQYKQLPLIIQEARRLLENWFSAMESGEVQRRMPDPLYPVKIDMLVANRIIEHIDREIGKELGAWAHDAASGGYTDGPGFSRLLPVQRLALAQQLHALKQKHKPGSNPPVQVKPGSVVSSMGVSLPTR
ncbi:MAG: hypothetical protein Q7K38_03520 [Candidatus Wildermuthbacteria bacterium]|nr:hypothetical protein [Candidatus Wildermuthbacteria bacterium]